MAKDSRKILHGIRMPKTENTERVTYKEGMEDELAKVATSDQLKTWLENGDIEGDWGKAAAPKTEGKK